MSHPDTSFPASMLTYTERNLCGRRQSTKEALLSLLIDEASNEVYFVFFGAVGFRLLCFLRSRFCIFFARRWCIRSFTHTLRSSNSCFISKLSIAFNMILQASFRDNSFVDECLFIFIREIIKRLYIYVQSKIALFSWYSKILKV